MVNFMEKVVEFLDKTLPIIIAPFLIVLLIRVIFQIITHQEV